MKQVKIVAKKRHRLDWYGNVVHTNSAYSLKRCGKNTFWVEWRFRKW